MSQYSKFLKIHPEVLLEWSFNSEDFISENYTVLSNLQTKTKSFISSDSVNLNKIDKTLFLIDPVLKKYSKVDTSKFNFLQTQEYFTNLIPYDTIRIYFPITWNFEAEEYKGFQIKIYTNDFYEKTQYTFSNYFFDDEDSSRQTEIQLNTPFLYDTLQWGKYIEFKIPSLDYISNQRITENTGNNYPTPNTINSNLTNNVGLSINSPILIDFSFIIATQTTFGTKYYTVGDTFKVSIPKVPEYADLSCEIVESTQGDFFEIYGLYNNSNENLDDFVDKLESQGKKIRIEYDVSLFEENILQRTQTFVVTENFAQKILYRPIITFSNTTAIIDVTLKLIDVVYNEQIIRKASIGLVDNLLKYGTSLQRINIENAFKPKIYNLKVSNSISTNENNNTTSNKFIVNKVPYPVLIDRFKITTSNGSTGEYKGLHQLVIILTPFDNFLTFQIATYDSVNNTNNPYDLNTILNNGGEIYLTFRNDSTKVEIPIFFSSSDINYTNGVISFKISAGNIPQIKIIRQTNKFFYIIAKGGNVENTLYIGRFFFHDDPNLKFSLSENSAIIDDSTNTSNLNSFEENPNFQAAGSGSTTANGSLLSSDALKRKNFLFFVQKQKETSFENYLNILAPSTSGQRFFKYTISNFLAYVVLALTQGECDEIKKRDEIYKISNSNQQPYTELEFNLGEDIAANKNISVVSEIQALQDRSNNIFLKWLNTQAVFVNVNGKQEPSEESKQLLITNLKNDPQGDILNRLLQLGLRLAKDNSLSTMWMVTPKNGKGNFYLDAGTID